MVAAMSAGVTGNQGSVSGVTGRADLAGRNGKSQCFKTCSVLDGSARVRCPGVRCSGIGRALFKWAPSGRARVERCVFEHPGGAVHRGVHLPAAASGRAAAAQRAGGESLFEGGGSVLDRGATGAGAGEEVTEGAAVAGFIRSTDGGPGEVSGGGRGGGRAVVGGGEGVEGVEGSGAVGGHGPPQPRSESNAWRRAAGERVVSTEQGVGPPTPTARPTPRSAPP
ncbi:hypothetical protein Kpho02_75720 [Kitasatospora phosalacinea]|uniref:Uncharacterized protein n=1 Tax=Kitasatospora phosalacinea TaxID=2065 RepID=A0A9W6V7I8_9ACTN|nr:hypothetical protein Kpho02_75720 [Kitasatospora phosalacinea]